MNQRAGKLQFLGHTAEVVDLSALLNGRTPVYPSDPPLRLAWHARCSEGGCNVGRIETTLHAGTHVESPLHYADNGTDIASLPLHLFAGTAVAFDAPKEPGQSIAAGDVPAEEIRPGDIVLFRTGWEERAGTARFYADEWPGFGADAVEALLDLRVKALGGDIPSVDSPLALGKGAPAHRRLLAAGVVVFEALVNLRAVAGRRFTFVGLPLRLEGAEASPVRAMAVLE